MDGTDEKHRDDEKIVKKNPLRILRQKKENDEATPDEANRRHRAQCVFVLMASFTVNGLVFGIVNCVSVIFNELKKNMEEDGVENAATKGSFVMSLSIGMTFFLSPVAGILTDIIGIRLTTCIGATLAISGLILSSFFPNNVYVLYFSFGVMLGVGNSLAYTPSLVILGHYFSKYLGLANGIATTGSSVYTLAYPYLLQFLIEKYGLTGCFLGLTALMSLLYVCAFVFKPVLGRKKPVLGSNQHMSSKDRCREIVNVDNWKLPKYIVWTAALPMALFGYFVSFVHIVSFVDEEFQGEHDGKILIQCLAGTSFLGRLIAGKAADFKWVNAIFLQQSAIYGLGVLTMLIPIVHNYYALVVICLIMGLFDGCFVTLMGPVAFKICGTIGASQGIGFMLGLCAIPITLGPPIAGFLYDSTKVYLYSFLCAGAMFLIGASTIFIMRCVKDPKPKEEVDNIDEVSVPLNERNEGVSDPKVNGGSRW